jgi:hypothetical protein
MLNKPARDWQVTKGYATSAAKGAGGILTRALAVDALGNRRFQAVPRPLNILQRSFSFRTQQSVISESTLGKALTLALPLSHRPGIRVSQEAHMS